MAYHNEYSDEWVVLPSEVDTVNNTVTASVSHFTTFAIIAYAGIPPSPPVPAAFVTSSLSISPLEVSIGEPVTISVLVTNIGEEASSYTVTLKVNGEIVGLEIDDFESIFLKKHPEIANAWKEIKPLCLRKKSRKVEETYLEAFLRIILEFLRAIFRDRPQQIDLNIMPAV